MDEVYAFLRASRWRALCQSCYYPTGRGLRLPSRCQAERAQLLLPLPHWMRSTPGGGLAGLLEA